MIVLFSAGCYSLRKKFIRKKSVEKEDAVYVDFKKYEAAEASGAYKDYELFFNSWLDEALKTINTTSNRKRVRRCLDEALINLEHMVSLCNRAGRNSFYHMYKDLSMIKSDFKDNPPVTSFDNNSYIQRITAVKSQFFTRFRYSLMEDKLR